VEQRRYVRQSLDLDAWITLKGGRRFTCQIKDFSLGGVFVVCSGLRDDAGVPVVEQQQVELQFVAGPTGTEQHHLLTGRLARVFKGGFGIEFVGPDPGTLLVMQELANKVHQKFLKGRALEAAREKAAAGPSSEEVANRLGIVKRLKTLVNGFLEEKYEALFTDANERLFEFSKTAPSDRDETDCFDARREIDNIRSLVEQSFLEAVLDHVESPGYPKLAGPEARVVSGLASDQAHSRKGHAQVQRHAARASRSAVGGLEYQGRRVQQPHRADGDLRVFLRIGPGAGSESHCEESPFRRAGEIRGVRLESAL
jgi:hypothetical protein